VSDENEAAKLREMRRPRSPECAMAGSAAPVRGVRLLDSRRATLLCEMRSAARLADRGEAAAGEEMIEAFPLYWPEGQTRVPDHRRRAAQFQVGFATARDHLVAELGRMGAKEVIVSSNVPLRRDGCRTRTRASRRTPRSPSTSRTASGSSSSPATATRRSAGTCARAARPSRRCGPSSATARPSCSSARSPDSPRCLRRAARRPGTRSSACRRRATRRRSRRRIGASRRCTIRTAAAMRRR
jgi:hypothetical protein